MSLPSQCQSCRLDAPAKLNLCLELLGRREDGFHAIRTLMATIGLCDSLRVTATAGDGVTLRVTGDPRHTAGVPTDGANLVVRAIEALRNAAGVERGVAVELVKRIPNQAGLGGGSSDAAAALIAAARVWKLGWSIERLNEVGATLGSDIPFFVAAIGDRSRRSAVATGRGETLTPAPMVAGLPVVVVKPDTGLSTAGVYGACRQEDYVTESHADRTNQTALALKEGDRRGLARSMTNALQAAATRLAPWIETLSAHFKSSHCEIHQLSGSGSAYFGLFPTMGEARRVAVRLRALRVGQALVTTIG